MAEYLTLTYKPFSDWENTNDIVIAYMVCLS